MLYFFFSENLRLSFKYTFWRFPICGEIEILEKSKFIFYHLLHLLSYYLKKLESMVKKKNLHCNLFLYMSSGTVLIYSKK